MIFSSRNILYRPAEYRNTWECSENYSKLDTLDKPRKMAAAQFGQQLRGYQVLGKNICFVVTDFILRFLLLS